jgi:hypothetical protein
VEKIYLIKFFKIFLFAILFFNTNTIYSQADTDFTLTNKKIKYDTTRIKDLSQKLSIWFYGIRKNYGLEIENITTNKTLSFLPNGKTNIGLGFNYKWMGIGIAFAAPWNKNDNDIYGNTKKLDLQVNVFSRTFGLDFSLQYYKGYYLSNPLDFLDWQYDYYPQLPEMGTLGAELSGYYFFNNKKFSYRAAFVRNEIQKKSAGSIILGGYLRWDVASTPNGFVPVDFPDSIESKYDILSYFSGNYGISFGYTYTLVFFKKFFMNLSLVPGVGVKTLLFNSKEKSYRPKGGLAARAVTRFALGYEHKYFYLGLSSIIISSNFEFDNYSISSSSTKFRMFIGKRFNVQKKKTPKE